jgi:hypothetical protein
MSDNPRYAIPSGYDEEIVLVGEREIPVRRGFAEHVDWIEVRSDGSGGD